MHNRVGTSEKLLQDFEKYLKGIGRSKKTCKLYIWSVRHFYRFLEASKHSVDPLKITWQEITDYIVEILSCGRYRPLTIQALIKSTEQFYRFLYKTGQIKSDPFKQIEMPVLGKRLPHNVPSPEEVQMLLETPNIETDEGIRDRAILETFYSCGIRLSELCGLKLNDINTTDQELTVFDGKGNKDRMVPIGAPACLWLRIYRDYTRPRLLTKNSGEHLFLGIKGKPINLLIVERRIKAYARELGLDSLTPHSLRHACGTHMITNGANVRYVQDILGHALVNTTQTYVHVTINDVKNMINSCHPRRKI